jgi:arginine decarboxylase
MGEPRGNEALFAVPELDPSESRLIEWRRVQALLDRAELASGRSRAELRDAAACALKLLGAWERYWVYPGPARWTRLHGELAAGRVVTAGALSRHMLSLVERVGDRAALFDDDDGWRAQRYVTVLVVHRAAELLALPLARALARLRRPDDRCRYELVAVDSVEDALCAVTANVAVGACLLGDELPWRGANRPPFAPPLLAPYDQPGGAASPWLDGKLEALRGELVRLPLDTPLQELHRLLAR